MYSRRSFLKKISQTLTALASLSLMSTESKFRLDKETPIPDLAKGSPRSWSTPFGCNAASIWPDDRPGDIEAVHRMWLAKYGADLELSPRQRKLVDEASAKVAQRLLTDIFRS